MSAPAARGDRIEPLSLLPIRAVWTLALNNQLTAAPAFDKDYVYFSISGDRIVSYDLATGTQHWLIDAKPLFQPAIGNDRLYAVEADSIVARRVHDGSVDWARHLDDTLAVAPVWDNGWLVLATTTGSILAYRATDGERIWRSELKSPAHAIPTLAADRVYVPTTDGRVVALQVDSGKPVWERRLYAAVGEILALDERVYAGTKDNFLYGLMTKDGTVDWRTRTGGPVVGAPISDQRNVYFTASDNLLRALSATSGSQKWMKALPIRPAWAPVQAGAVLIVGGQSSTLRAYSMKDGNSAGEIQTDAEVTTRPRVFEDPQTTLPMLMAVTRNIAKGAAAKLVMRTLDPESQILTSPLPNVISMSQAETDRR